MTFKTFASGLGNGLLSTAGALIDLNTQTRLDEIDVEIRKLQEERTELESRLVSR